MNVTWKSSKPKQYDGGQMAYDLTGGVVSDSSKPYAYRLRVIYVGDDTAEKAAQSAIIEIELQRWLDSPQSK